MEYQLVCTECSFTTVVEGTIGEAHEAIENHQEENGDEHFMNVRLLSE